MRGIEKREASLSPRGTADRGMDDPLRMHRIMERVIALSSSGMELRRIPHDNQVVEQQNVAASIEQNVVLEPKRS